MADGISHSDVARFVSDYVDGAASLDSVAQSAPTGYLLRDIAVAYLSYRALPASALAEVMALVDSVL